MRIHVVIPAFNEAGRIEATLDALYEYHREGPHDLAVSVVDDGSTDPTVSIVKEYGDSVWPDVRILRLPRNLGKGAAVRYGMLHLSRDCDWALLSDADLSSPIEEVERLLAHGARAGVIIGSRALDPSLIHVRQPLHRQTMGKVYNFFVRMLNFGGYHDTQCGFKLFRPHIAAEVFQDMKVQGFSYDVEAIALALRKGYRVLEVAVRWDHMELSRVRISSAPARMFMELLRIRSRYGRVRPAYPPAADDARLQTAW